MCYIFIIIPPADHQCRTESADDFFIPPSEISDGKLLVVLIVGSSDGANQYSGKLSEISDEANQNCFGSSELPTEGTRTQGDFRRLPTGQTKSFTPS
ncbi:hypothetical protein [Chryseobacterium ginsengisoli]|uniref:hypothetical protein n=1 Tax=Chryseobacterium ginsengisoli TaxID=363853 RepID=UPI0031E9BA9A